MKPILFNTEMVKQILSGRKTQTRRPIKNIVPDEWEEVNDCRNSQYGSDVSCYLVRKIPTEETGIIYPKYEMGDILYVRETWNKLEDWGEYPDDEEDAELIYYKADFPEDIWYEETWRPSIHMPKSAARIFLKIKNVRAERLQDILCSDMKSEGCIPENVKGGQYQQWQRDYWMPLWDGIYKNGGYGWAKNPWVFVYEFERTQKED